MQSHHHIGHIRALVSADVSTFEPQSVIAQFFRQFIAMPDHISLQIQSGHLNISMLQFMQIVVHGKGKIGFAAAEINNAESTVLR